MSAIATRVLPPRTAPALALLAAFALVLLGTGTPARASGEVGIDEGLTVTLNLAVDDMAIAASERRLVLTAVLSNSGPEVELAVCPGLFFGGELGTLQGYTFAAGEGIPSCTASYEHAPNLSASLDAIQVGDPACPSPDAVSEHGDIITVPGSMAGVPGTITLRYEYLLQDLGMEALEESAIRDLLHDAEGFHLDTLSSIDPELAALVCVNGADTFLAAPPVAEASGETDADGSLEPMSLSSDWLQMAVPAEGTVVSEIALWSAHSFDLDADATAQVEVLWEDNLDTALSDHLTMAPEAGVDFTLSPESFRMGTLTAEFPAELEEGFLGRATVITRLTGSDEVVSESVQIYALDTTAPEIGSAHTERGEANLEVSLVATDAAAGINAARLVSTVNGSSSAPGLMAYTGGDFRGPTGFASLVDPVEAADVAGASVSVADELGNEASATLPVAAAGEDRTEECVVLDGNTGTLVELDGSSSTIPPVEESETTTFTWSNGFGTAEGEIVEVELPLGESAIALDLEDERGFTGHDDVSITVVDTTPPVIESIEIPMACVWPPNHKYARFELGTDIIVEATDLCDHELDVRIVQVTSDQPDNGNGDGNTVDDVLYGESGTCVRSERAGKGKWGRTYAVVIEVADDSGNTTWGNAYIRVPHDQSKKRGCMSYWESSDFLEDGDPACDFSDSGSGDPGGGDPDERVWKGKAKGKMNKKAKKQKSRRSMGNGPKGMDRPGR